VTLEFAASRSSGFFSGHAAGYELFNLFAEVLLNFVGEIAVEAAA
jgi:hypothetical protein